MKSSTRIRPSTSLWWLLLCKLLVMSSSFSILHRQRTSPLRRPVRTRQWQRKAIMDPSTMTNAISQTQHHVPHPSQTAEALLNTMYSFSTSNLSPAHGHSNPLFGPPDPLLQAGKSIAPSAKALMDIGISKAAATPIPDVPAALQSAIAKSGTKLLDARSFIPESVLPGFQMTRGILPEHDPMVTAQNSPEAFAAMVDWNVGFLRIVETLPYLALAYVMIDFFIVRPNLDWYKQELEDEPAQALADVFGSTAVRMGIFMVLATVTMTVFG